MRRLTLSLEKGNVNWEGWGGRREEEGAAQIDRRIPTWALEIPVLKFSQPRSLPNLQDRPQPGHRPLALPASTVYPLYPPAPGWGSWGC